MKINKPMNIAETIFNMTNSGFERRNLIKFLLDFSFYTNSYSVQTDYRFVASDNLIGFYITFSDQSKLHYQSELKEHGRVRPIWPAFSFSKESGMSLKKAIPIIAKNLDKDIEKIMGQRVGFTLVVHSKDYTSYISNYSREKCLHELKHLVELWDKGMFDSTPSHEVH